MAQESLVTGLRAKLFIVWYLVTLKGRRKLNSVLIVYL